MPHHSPSSLTFILITAAILVGCHDGDAGFRTGTDIYAISAQENLELKESPLLSEQVKKGNLPPLDERLPEYPIVVPVVERLGYYGGIWRHYHIGTDMLTMRFINNYTPLVRWNSDVSDLVPGLAESWEFSPDGRNITFHLRKGVRWSDGEFFTSRDILFWWELCNDPRVPIVPPEWAFVNGKLMEVTAPDPYTVKFSYNDAFYFMPNFMATGYWVPENMLIPFHYMKQFHPDYNPQFTDFKEFLRKNGYQNLAVGAADNTERPTLCPWKLNFYSSTADRVVYERNPYYYAVDSNGRQLPYIDRIESLRMQSDEAGILLIIAGQVDAQFRLIGQNNYAFLKRFADRNDYRILRWQEGTAAWYSVCINWDVEDSTKRILFRDKRFRRALSVAIDRDKINQIAWHGLGRPQAAAITDESWHFRSPEGQAVLKEWITRWSQYDPALAQKYLDQCGMKERDSDGYRIFQGKRFEILLEYFDDSVASDEAYLISNDWNSIGIRTLTRRSVGSDLWTKVRGGQFDMYLQHNSEMDLFSFPAWVFPTTDINWHPKIGKWYMTGGKEGEKPDGVMAELLEIYERCKKEPDLAKRHRLVLDAIRLHLEEGPFMLGTCGRQPDLVITKKNFRNVPENGILGPHAICQPGSKWPEQFFIDPYMDFADTIQ